MTTWMKADTFYGTTTAIGTLRHLSREVDFGVGWDLHGICESVDTYSRITWVEATGEVYVTGWNVAGDRMVGIIVRGMSEAEVEARMTGWAGGERKSVGWAVERLTRTYQCSRLIDSYRGNSLRRMALYNRQRQCRSRAKYLFTVGRPGSSDFDFDPVCPTHAHPILRKSCIDPWVVTTLKSQKGATR